jgi:hypothetical protein
MRISISTLIKIVIQMTKSFYREQESFTGSEQIDTECDDALRKSSNQHTAVI